MNNPQVMISYSDNNGHTFSHEIWKPLVGDKKEYLTRIRIQRGGSAYSRIYRLTFSDASSFTLISAHARIRLGD